MDSDISKITVKISDENQNLIGTGILVQQSRIKNYVYFVTAAHCLYEDGDSFTELRKIIVIEIEDSINGVTAKMELKPMESLISHQSNNDLGVICIEKSSIKIDIPEIKIIKKYQSSDHFIIKGFPRATKGEEVDTIYPKWKQELSNERFNLTFVEDYSSYNTQGFSGSGVFVSSDNNFYLLGIFTRFRPEDKGRAIYCQYVETLDCILSSNYLPALTYSYIGRSGISKDFFEKNIEKSICNLGERYNEKLNFKLPITHRFSELSKDNLFKTRLLNIFDGWLTDRDIDKCSRISEIEEIETELKLLREQLIEWEKDSPINICDDIDLDWFLKNLEKLDTEIDKKISELYDLRWKEDEKKKNSANKNNEKYYEKAISRLGEISRRNYTLKSEFDCEINLGLVNNPFLIINGAAGCGKSHLLGDIANDRFQSNLPSLLLLGQLFNSSITIEQNILNQLDLSGKFSDFLWSLNDIGQQINARVLIMIDAINETTDAEKLWKNQILGFIKEVSRFPFIGVVFTIRDTYFEYILPEKISEIVNVIKHQAFKGNEYEALKLFCSYYGLEQPNIPMLYHEFGNPLFLKLCCSGIANAGGKSFPSGFNGINKVFNYYVDSVYSKLSDRPEYKLQKKIVWNAINLFAKECLKRKERYLEINFTIDLFSKNFPRTPKLLIDLIEEGLLIKSVTKYYQDEDGNYVDENIEIIYFAYERLGDYLIANYELESFADIEELKLAFSENGKFGKYMEGHHYDNDGILEAFSVLLPEKFSIELFELSVWLFDKYFGLVENLSRGELYKTHHLKYNCEYLNDLLLKSLKWRTIESIDEEKISKYFQTKEFQIQLDYNFYLNILLELSCVEHHPMNSDRLFRVLIRQKMADRDAFLQDFIMNYSGNNDDNVAQSIKRLLEFAWQPIISNSLSHETCRLIGQTLIWVLSTTNTELRDKVTKALVNLLEQKPLVLLTLLAKFKRVNDLYILERLYAVTYGVVLRTDSEVGIAKLAQFTYNTIFKKGKPPTHILLRDYARNIIEYALYKNLNINLVVASIRPPYISEIPKLPTNDDIKKYHIHHESDEFKKDPDRARLFCKPYYSTLNWGDFGRKIVDNKIDDFYPISFTKINIYKDFLRNLSRDARMIIKLYVKNMITEAHYHRNSYNIKRQLGDEKFDELIQGMGEMQDKIDGFIKDKFENSDYNYVKSEIIPYLLNQNNIKFKWGDRKYLNPEPFKRWIVERVHKLGFDVEKHGLYDQYQTNFSGQSYSAHVERISKKYQWIAFYEIMAIISDNYEMKTGYGSNSTHEYYKGTWQSHLRDIDPAYVTPNKEDRYSEKVELVTVDKCQWTDDEQYKYWNAIPSEWVTSENDLPKICDVILKKDYEGNEWLNLQKYIEWREPKLFGEDKYDRERKEIWYSVQAYICKKSDKDRILKYLQQQNFWGDWMPSNNGSFSSIFNREKFWSPAYIDETKQFSQKEWVNIRNTNYKIIVASTEAKGSLEEDKSGANMTYNIPCKILFEGMNLNYSPTDGDFTDISGEIIVTNASSSGVLIRKDKILQFLERNNFEIFWAVFAEKNAKTTKKFFGDYLFGQYSGLFFFKDQNLNGSLDFKIKN